MSGAGDPNLLRILVSTDNHLGVWEKDEVRREDSFEAFEEVLRTANNLGVDCVLLGGDLFHDNKPSRATLVKAINSVSRHCLNDKPVGFQILSDQAANFVSGQVNFLDPNINIGLPIFTIHGNHDDPSGSDNLSAVDIMSSCRLVNYFGKHLLTGSMIGKLTISPILMQKGTTRLALYGLGSIRDERLARLFAQAGMVSWCRPQATAEAAPDDWVNVMVLHQNRVDRGVNAKNAVRESHLPAFMDLVVWGHEHECRPNTEDLRNPDNAVQNKVSKVLQPGSSVATSLSEGEAKRKHIFLLEVLNNSYRIISYQLRSVRPFAFESVVLKEAAEVKVEEPDSVSTFLEEKVVSLIDRLATEQPPMEGCPPMLPLVRLRVDYTGFSTINAQRFGQKFVNRVANPQDLLVWHKAPVRKARPDGSSRGVDESDEMLRPEQLDQQRIEDLVAANLHDSLRFLHEDDLAAALHDFVEKDDKTALLEVLQASLRETARPLMADAEALGAMPDDDSVIEQALQDAVQQRRDAKAAHPSGAGPSSVRDPPPALEVSYLDPGAGGKDAPGTVAYAARDGGDRIEDFDDGGGTGTNTSAGSMLPPKGRGTLTHTHIGTGTGAGSMLPPKGRGSRGGRGGAKAAAAPKSRAKPDTAARGKGAKASPAATPAGPSLRQPNLFEAFSASQQPSGASRQDAVPLDDNDDDGGGVVDDAHSDGDDDFISDGDGDDGYAPSGSKAKPRGGASASKRGGAAAAAATPVRSQRSKAASRGGGAAGTPASGRAGVAQAADPIEVNSDGDGDAGFSVGAGGSAAGGSAAGGATPGVTQGRVATGGTTQTTQGGTRKRPASFMSTSQAKPGTQGKKNWGSAR